MHERSVLRGVLAQLDAVAAAEGAARVTRVTVRLGALSHFTPQHFREHFEDASRGTVAEGAAVDAVTADELTGVVIESVEVEL